MDGDGGNGVVTYDGVDDILSLGGFPKDSMLSVKMRSRSVGDEKLGAIGVWASICHG